MKMLDSVSHSDGCFLLQPVYDYGLKLENIDAVYAADKVIETNSLRRACLAATMRIYCILYCALPCAFRLL